MSTNNIKISVKIKNLTTETILYVYISYGWYEYEQNL